MTRLPYVSFAAGLALALVAAAIIFEGSLFGEETFGVALLIGWVGIGLILISGVGMWGKRRKPRGKPG